MDRQYNNTRQGLGSGGPGLGPGPNPNKNGRNGIIQHSQPSRQFQAVPYTQEEHLRIQEQLNKVLGPEYVSIRPGGGGQNVSYIEGWKALNLANEVFGFNGWSSELISTQVDYFDTHGNRFSMGLSVVVRITIKDGTYHEDFGYGFIDNAKSKAMAFEKCKKEAFTDGLKRCLRCFGNVLGNCLYDRTIMAKIQKVKLPPVQLEEENFHRDPLLVKREERKKHIQTVNILEDRDTNGNNGESKATNSSENPTTKGDPANGSPQAKMDIAKDFDDSLLFSDDQPADTEAKSPKGIDASELQMIFHEDRGFSQEQLNNEDDVPHFSDDFDTSSRQSAPPNMGGEVTTPKQVTSPLFVSAKSADLVQQGDPKADVPKYDTKFVSQSIRRTIDPMKSVPVKRSEVRPSANHLTPLASKSNNSLNLNSASLGKRMIGLPPSQQPKRRRADDKENQ